MEHFKHTKQDITTDQLLYSVLMNLLSGEELAGVERCDCVLGDLLGAALQGCQMAKFDPFLSMDCARVEGAGRGAIQEKEGIKFCSAA